MAYLEVRTKKGTKKLRLDGRTTSIGRHPDSNLVITDERSSREHCVIEPVPEGFRVRDLGSRNGTRLNEKKIDVEILDHNDVIRIGKTILRFVDPSQTREPKKRTRRPDFDALAYNPPASKGEAPAPPEPLIEGPSSLDPSPPSGNGSVSSATEPTLDLEQAVQDARTPYEHRLQEIIRIAPNKQFDVGKISLIDTRGQTVHQAMSVDEEASEEELGEGIRAFRLLLMTCFAARATDLHLEPKREEATARMRVDGYMVSACEMPRSVYQRIFGLVKILCQIDTSRKNVVQEGHFTTAVPGRRVDYRVSFTPSMHGQKLVIRVLDTANAPTRLHELGLAPWMYEKLRNSTQRDSGMLVSCGPTGSGKTTTLYSALREIDVDLRNIITIEDPVEYSLEGCTQIPVDTKQGNSFGQMLRSVLRQDPDVIFVGEIRDEETAKTAMQAAMTGHLVFTTVHAKDSIGAIFRILDLGVEPYLVANSVNLILAQRLVRLLCPTCKKAVRPTPGQTMRMGKYVEGISEVYVATGCKKCLKTGYIGRCAVFELLDVNDEVRDVILNKPAIQEIRNIIKRGLFHSLQQSGYQLVSRGVTSPDEVERVAGGE